jgi:hypothetical protein
MRVQVDRWQEKARKESKMRKVQRGWYFYDEKGRRLYYCGATRLNNATEAIAKTLNLATDYVTNRVILVVNWGKNKGESLAMRVSGEVLQSESKEITREFIREECVALNREQKDRR